MQIVKPRAVFKPKLGAWEVGLQLDPEYSLCMYTATCFTLDMAIELFYKNVQEVINAYAEAKRNNPDIAK